MDKIRARRGVSTDWALANPKLDLGELGYETDTGRLKFGDGVTNWNLLEYAEKIAPAQSYVCTVATVPVASVNTSNLIYVSDEVGGATMAFSDGTNWRRVQDRNVISI